MKDKELRDKVEILESWVKSLDAKFKYLDGREDWTQSELQDIKFRVSDNYIVAGRCGFCNQETAQVLGAGFRKCLNCGHKLIQGWIVDEKS